MTKFKKPLLFALSLVPFAIIAGIFVGYYQMETVSEDIIQQAVAQLGSIELLIVVTVVQTVGYALFCGFFGYILAEKLGLMKSFSLAKKSIVITLIISVIGGIIFALDYWTFGNIVKEIQTVNSLGLSVNSFITSVLYGGIIEEIMLRLFFMSLIAFIIWKLFYKKYKKENIPTVVFVIANVVSAVVFATSHLPATIALFGTLTPVLLFRCFLLNGGFGLVFGYLYRKFGLQYSIIAHATFHVVSKLIWIIFI